MPLARRPFGSQPRAVKKEKLRIRTLSKPGRMRRTACPGSAILLNGGLLGGHLMFG
jgi:hypothetical protein